VFEHREVESARDVVVGAGRVVAGRPAVGDEPVGIGQGGEERVDLGAEGVLVAVARAVHPPHGPRAALAGQGMQHREDWLCADPGANQRDGAPARAQDEVPPRGGSVDDVADRHMVMQVPAAGALALHADAVAVLVGQIRERVAADQRRRAGVGTQAQGEVLAGARRWGRESLVGGHKPERGDRGALATDLDNAQRLEPRPRRCRCGLVVRLRPQLPEALGRPSLTGHERRRRSRHPRL
jgi:hypothetical protein